MLNIVRKAKAALRAQDGAALLEYTVLLGIILVGVIVTIGLVGGWVQGEWNALWAELS